MPEFGPEGLYVYLPQEAYRTMGRHLFGNAWSNTYNDVVLPHPPAATARLANEDLTGEQQQIIGDPNSAEYQERQARSFQSRNVFRHLVEALEWGKTDGWYYHDDEWTRIPYEQWGVGSQCYAKLEADLLAVFRDNLPSSKTLWIEQQRLDDFIAGVPVPAYEPYQPSRHRRAPGRPGHDWDAVQAEFQRMVEEGEVPQIRTGWKTTAAELLLAFMRDELRVKLPVRPTVIKEMKVAFDAYEASAGPD
jgi:hypothetical protein